MHDNRKIASKTILGFASLIFFVFLGFGKVIRIQIDEPCTNASEIPIVSEIGPFWVKLAGNEERLWIGTKTNIANMPGTTSEVWLVSLADDEVSFIISHRFRNLVAGEGYKTEWIHNHCQFTFSNSDPFFKSRVPVPLLRSEDFSQNWEISEITELVSTQDYSVLGDSVDSYKVRVRASNNSHFYMIWLIYYEFPSAESADAEMDYRTRRSYYGETTSPDFTESNEINIFQTCNYIMTECIYIIQSQEYFQQISMRFLDYESQEGADSIVVEDWQDLIELANEKFLTAIEE